jgi:hypothetical protein
MGLALVTVQVSRVAPSAELEKALQTPTREGLQQKADEAMFSRRALAVEKERAIKENELATELELEKRKKQLIEQRGANQLQEVQQVATTEKARVEADLARLQLTAEAETRRSMTLAKTEVEKSKLIADAYARDTLLRAEGDTKARTLWNQIEQQREAERIALWEKTPQRVSTAFALQAAAAKLDKINHLNLTPDLLKTLVTELATERSGT